MIDGNMEVLRHLSTVSNDFVSEMIREFPAM
jgi:hypothetical protein